LVKKGKSYDMVGKGMGAVQVTLISKSSILGLFCAISLADMMKTIPVVIRKASPSDLSTLTELLGELFGIEQDFVANPRRQRRGLKLILSTPDEWQIFVAETGGRVVGMCSIHRLISTAEGVKAALIEDMVVHVSVRGRGIGGKLLKTAQTWCFTQGLRRLQLLADSDNEKALAFYKRHGWNRTNLICLRKTGRGHGKQAHDKHTEM
jgi:GNAT superfamily N-acetyltransferase